MIVEAHLLCWNESETIAFTVRYYRQFCDRVIIHDNFSDDNTREIAESEGAEVRMFGIAGELNDLEYKKLKNSCWKGSKADWVIVADCDEILYHHNYLHKILSDSKDSGYTIFETRGFNIYSNDMPKESFLEIQTGIMDDSYSKHVIFNPQAITDINYEFGAHAHFKPIQGNVNYSPVKLWLLHYRCIGGAERVVNRHALYRPRLSAINKKWNLGHHYNH